MVRGKEQVAMAFFFFFFLTYIKLKLGVLCKKKKGREKRIQEVWEKVMYNLEFEAKNKEILLLWAGESGS